MANKTVVIDCDEQGNYSVGEEPHEAQSQEGAEGAQPEGGEMQMQPAKDLDDALAQAKALFSQGDQGGDNGEAEFQSGYQGVNASPMGA